MHAMVLRKIGMPLQFEELPDPQPGIGQVLIRIDTCGVCRTDLHVIDGELADVAVPLIPGHQIVGVVVATGEPQASQPAIGDRVGVPWLGHACGECLFCRRGDENLCDAPQFTGYTRPGGFATHILVEAAFCIHLREHIDPVATAPLLCAGLIGWRSLVKTADAACLGIYGFGAAAHIVIQIALWQGRRVHAFTRPGDTAAQQFARRLGASSANSSLAPSPEPLDAAIIFAPDGALVPLALSAVRKGGRVVCAGIHMSDFPALRYRLLWEERQLMSVANLTRADAREFFRIADQAKVSTTTQSYRLQDANRALDDLRHGRLQGSAVLICNDVAGPSEHVFTC
jgi:propanol-preferring alcohol dehydrogenase